MRRFDGEVDLGAAPGAGEPDMGEAALLLEAGAAALVEGALVREQALLPAGQEHGVEFEALRGMQRHEADALGRVALVRLHDERDVLEEALQVRELLHRAHELLQVVEAARRRRPSLSFCHMSV